MSDSTKAVFLSYARDDAEAARRVADALRGFGVEVWFDQNELRGGDSWDAKIRKQIRECALFIPIISGRSESRHEGYFRREWNLAVERTLDMAHDAAFLVPVVIDGTPENAARVPDKFRAVQWTRLPGGEPNPHFVERVRRLLESPGGTAAEVRSGSAAPVRGSPHKSVPGWVWALAGVAVLAAAIGWFELHPRAVETAAPPPAASAASESGALVARARALYEKWDLATPGDFATADQLLKRALEIDPNDGAAWTSYAIMSYGMVIFDYDDRDARLPIVLDAAQRAVSLAPDSDYAQFALALSYRFQPTTQEECLRRLEALAARCPADKFILRMTGACLNSFGHPEEAIPYFDRAAALPGGDPIAWYIRGVALNYLHRYDEAETSIDQALALEPSYPLALGLKARFLCNRGDLAAAQLEIGRLPAGSVAEDSTVLSAFYIWSLSRRADKALEAIAGDPHPYLQSNITGSGPKAYFAGIAYSLDGRTAAAQAEWRAALQLIDQRLAANPNSRDDLRCQALLRAHLGDRAGTETSMQLYQQMQNNISVFRGNDARSYLITFVDTYAALGRYDEALDAVATVIKDGGPRWNFGWMHFSPELDPLRDNPRFKALLAEVDAANPDAATRLHETAK